jgi:hypothetical protein
MVVYQPDEWEVNREEIVFDKQLGKGAFGLVFSGKWLPGDVPVDVAIKVCICVQRLVKFKITL